jgi:hypothetical protein
LVSPFIGTAGEQTVMLASELLGVRTLIPIPCIQYMRRFPHQFPWRLLTVWSLSPWIFPGFRYKESIEYSMTRQIAISSVSSNTWNREMEREWSYSRISHESGNRWVGSTVIPSVLSQNQLATGVGRWIIAYVAWVQIEDEKGVLLCLLQRREESEPIRSTPWFGAMSCRALVVVKPSLCGRTIFYGQKHYYSAHKTHQQVRAPGPKINGWIT